MRSLRTLHLRLGLSLICILTLALTPPLPFAAQQPTTVFDEARIVADVTSALQLTAEQAAELKLLLTRRRPRVEQLVRQMNGVAPGSPPFNETRGQLEGERRLVLEEFLPSLRPEQQTRLRNFINNPTPAAPSSAVAPLKASLPPGWLAANERLIPLPGSLDNPNNRRRLAAASTPQLTDEQKILHLLNRAGFGPRPGDIERVRQMGLDRYLEEQLHPADLADELLARPLQALTTLQMTVPEVMQTFLSPAARPTPTPAATPKPLPTLSEATNKGGTTSAPGAQAAVPEQSSNPLSPPMSALSQPMTAPKQPTPTARPARARDGQQPLRELQQAKLLRAVFSERQLQEVLVDFWFNHFNVFAGKDNARYLLTAYERDVIRPHVLGRFKELLVAVAQSPAMLYYLDNFLSQVEPPPAAPKYDADGNLMPAARRPGLNENYARELLELHTLGVEGGYTQADVQSVARAFTGWTIGQTPNALFIFRPRAHDRGEKLLLGTRLAPGGGIEDGLRVLDVLAKHPATARFIARKLSQRFVADEPPSSLVDRAAQVFTSTGGDLREVVRTILTAPEFYWSKHYRNKIKAPFDLAASMLRATGAASDAAAPLIQWVARMGEPLYLCQPPTGYAEDSSRWLSNATLLERMNFAVALLGNRINGTRVDAARLVTPEAGKDSQRLLEQLLSVLIHSDVSRETREHLTRVLNEQRAKLLPAKYNAKTAPRNNELIGGLAALMLGAREFQLK